MSKSLLASNSGYNYLTKTFKITRKTTFEELNDIKMILKKTFSIEELGLLKDDLQGEFESAKAGNTLIAGFAIYATLGNAALTFASNYSAKVQEQLEGVSGKTGYMLSSALIASLGLFAIGILAMVYSRNIYSRVKRTSILCSMVNKIYEEKIEEDKVTKNIQSLIIAQPKK
ncbi:hypothetical protein [Paenibacillus campi]|uniref:hypothetical protein n=1 Tax=Paenibacillus campi TaxID=3106031 RepID=UPI002AFDD0EE|nr:hypothetical protein [Paenibacillus sp. SGZ-1009]